MYQPQHKRSSTGLWLLIGLAVIYSSALYFLHTLTGTTRLDASIGVVLGLFIASRPAANMLDMILFGRSTQPILASRRSEMLWLALNVTVLLIGLFVITTGTTRFASAGR